nr:hypothetical protein [Tanacetum cinerariifolium]
MNDVDYRWNKMIKSGDKIIQILGEMILQQEQAANLSTHTPKPSRHLNSICYDHDDDDEEKTIPLCDIISQLPPKRVKSSVEDFVLIPSEFEDTSGSDSECDLPSCDDFSHIDVPKGKSVAISNPLFDSNDDFTSSDDESLSDEDVPEDNVKIYSNPLFEFDDEYISGDVNPLFDEVLEDIESKAYYDFNLDELALLVRPLFDSNEDDCFDPGGDVDEINAFDIPFDFKDDYYDSEGDEIYLESFLSDDTTPNLPTKVAHTHEPTLSRIRAPVDSETAIVVNGSKAREREVSDAKGNSSTGDEAS